MDHGRLRWAIYSSVKISCIPHKNQMWITCINKGKSSTDALVIMTLEKWVFKISERDFLFCRRGVCLREAATHPHHHSASHLSLSLRTPTLLVRSRRLNTSCTFFDVFYFLFLLQDLASYRSLSPGTPNPLVRSRIGLSLSVDFWLLLFPWKFQVETRLHVSVSILNCRHALIFFKSSF